MSFLQNLRFGIRMLAKAPGVATAAILSLALGIGANTAIFSLIDAILLRTLPVASPQDLRLIGVRNGAVEDIIFSYPLFADLRTGLREVASVAARTGVSLTLLAGGEPQRVSAELISGNYFETLQTGASLGRTIAAADDQEDARDAVAVISYDFWRRRFSADPAIIGRVVRLNYGSFTIVGVTRPEFTGVRTGETRDIYLPLTKDPRDVRGFVKRTDRGSQYLQMFARLKPGVSDQAAEQMASAILRRASEQEIGEGKGWTAAAREESLRRAAVLSDGSRGRTPLRDTFGAPLWVLMAVVGAVLLIACLNVANLLMARAAGRQREFAVRAALGAGRGDMIRQLLAEGVLLAFAGGACGLLFSAWGTDLLVSMLPSNDFRVLLDLRPNLRVLGFTLALVVATALIFGFAPAISAIRNSFSDLLKRGSAQASGGRMRFRQSLVAVQLALSLILIGGAGLFLSTLYNLKAIDHGYSGDSVVMASIDPGAAGYRDGKLDDFYRRLRDRILTQPQVSEVGIAAVRVMTQGRMTRSVVIPKPDGGTTRGSVHLNVVSPGYLRTMGIGLLSGRDFGPRDDGRVPVAIVSESFQRAHFPDSSPLGRKFRLGSLDVEIIAVVRDARYNALRLPAPETVLVPLSQDLTRVSFVTLHVRASTALAAREAMRASVKDIDPALPIYSIREFDDEIENSLAQERILAVLSVFFGALAISLAAIGLFGVISGLVAGRVREIGIRMALGANRRIIVFASMRSAAVLLIAGLAGGLAGYAALARFIQTLLFEVRIWDPMVPLGAASVLTLVAACAVWIPVRRAASIQPSIALRHD